MTTTAPSTTTHRAAASAPAPIICVCGLHGGAGTTTTSVLLATAAAATTSKRGDVTLVDADPAAGGLALHLGAASPDTLHTLAPEPAHHWTEHQGVRLLAGAPAPGRAAPAAQLTAALEQLADEHRIVVIDAGRISDPVAQQLLTHADLVLWSIDATTTLPAAAHTLASPLTRAARHAPWALAAHTTGRDGLTPPANALAALAPDLRGLALIPRLNGLPPEHPARASAATHLLALLS